MDARQALRRVVVMGAFLLVILSNGTVGVLSEASGEILEASGIAVYKQPHKANLEVAPSRFRPVAENIAPLLPIAAAPESQNTTPRSNNPRQQEWPCQLPEGCDGLSSESQSSTGALNTADSIAAAAPQTLETQIEKTDQTWVRRYQVYQQLITKGSTPLLQLDSNDALTQDDEIAIRLLHGRADVQNNAQHIQDEGRAYPDVPPILVAAAIAEQASDVERLFGVDALEKMALAVPGLDNMSIGIAQLRPGEALSLGLGEVDLFDPKIAIRGMYTKIDLGNTRITQLQDPAAPLALTDRYMLLSLAQNGTSEVDEFFALGNDWSVTLVQGNNARVMRYFVVHLDWLLLDGWTLPEGVDLEYWREIVFSVP